MKFDQIINEALGDIRNFKNTPEDKIAPYNPDAYLKKAELAIREAMHLMQQKNDNAPSTQKFQACIRILNQIDDVMRIMED